MHVYIYLILCHDLFFISQFIGTLLELIHYLVVKYVLYSSKIFQQVNNLLFITEEKERACAIATGYHHLDLMTNRFIVTHSSWRGEDAVQFYMNTKNLMSSQIVQVALCIRDAFGERQVWWRCWKWLLCLVKRVTMYPLKRAMHPIRKTSYITSSIKK